MASVPPTSPFPPRISPYAAAAEREVRAYLRRCGLLRSSAAAEYYDSSRLGYLTAQIYPDALRDRLLLVSRWFCVWTVFDDQLEKLPDDRPATAVDLVADLMLSWLGPQRTANTAGEVPFATGFGNAWADIRARSSPAWQERFLAHTRQYLTGCRWEAENRRTAIVPDLESYMVRRRRFGGIRMAMDLSEFSGGYELPNQVHAAPPIQELLDVLGDITLWGNDLFSIQVDQEEGNVSNLVFVLQHWHSCDLQEALATARAMLAERLDRLRAVENELADWCAAIGLPARQRHDVARFVEGLHTWISGNIAWSRDNVRYTTATPRVGGSQPNFLLALVPP
jgi:5-epi-alpha-selinene synthase